MAEKNTVFKVSSVNWKGHLKRLTLQPGPHWLTLPLSSCVSTGDRVRLTDEEAWVICQNGQAQILQPYAARETLALGGLQVEAVVKEITEPDEHNAYKSLAEYHYRDSVIHGRTARLIVCAFHPLFPQVLGYVELATPFYMNKGRANILNAHFKSGTITWEAWDKLTMRQYIHVLVRIARCIVYPEFRSVGLGQILVKHAAEFARQRWQAAGFLPYFLEISADMLKYVPFAEKAGMLFIGETEGNLRRVAKDMEYLIRNAERVKAGEIVSKEACGIVDQQVARMDRALGLMEREGMSRGQLVERLQSLSQEVVLRDFALFHNIVSLPKPTYVKGLHPDAEEFLARRVAEVAPHNGHIPVLPKLEPLKGPVVFRNMTLSYRSQVRRTSRPMLFNRRSVSHQRPSKQPWFVGSRSIFQWGAVYFALGTAFGMRAHRLPMVLYSSGASREKRRRCHSDDHLDRLTAVVGSCKNNVPLGDTSCSSA
jgi:GNAT superfamily N-acetyltransferase